MPQTRYAAERLLVLRRLREEAGGTPLTEFFRPQAKDLRFHLGTSLADLRIPYRTGPSLVGLVQAATIDAYLLAGLRHKPGIPAAEFEKLALIDGFDPAALRPLSYLPPVAVTRESMRRVFLEACTSHVGVDAGLVASFLGTERPGRAFAFGLHTLFSKSREEAARAKSEPTPYIVALALRGSAEASWNLTRDAPVKEPMGRFLRAASASLLAQAAQFSLRESGLARVAGLVAGTAGATQSHFTPREVRTALLSFASLGLLPFLGVRGSTAQTGLSVYGVAFDTPPPRLEEVVGRIAQGADPEEQVRDYAAWLSQDRDLSKRLERAAAISELRELGRNLSRALDGQRESLAIPGEGTLEKFLSLRDGVDRLFANEVRRKELSKSLRSFEKSVQTDDARHKLEVLAHAAHDFREDAPASWMGAAEGRLAVARAVVAQAVDIHLDRLAAAASQLLLERTGNESEGGENAEYETGRMYLVSHEPGPLLNARLGAVQVAHLFCDMKDFTRRTAFLKESVIADFLRREFYAPILAAASGQDPGARSPTTPRSVTLNNLLGDAVSFSGDVVSLVQLAQDTRKALRDYSQRLAQEGTQESVAARMRELGALHAQRKEAMERSLRELVARAPKFDPGIRDSMLYRAEEIRRELTQLDAQFQAEKAKAVGEKLEAGTFVSFGAAPEVARFDDPAFGSIRVAIAEKINESARGTARSGSVKAYVDGLLTRARKQTGLDLLLPFHVLVASPPSVSLTPDQTLALRDAVAAGDTAAAQKIGAEAAARVIGAKPGPGDLYNGGTALSEEALKAWLEAKAPEHVVRREITSAALHPTIRDRFFLPIDPVQIVACGGKALTELFVFQGRVLFKGFESTGGLGVWELMDPADPFFALIGAHHFAEWIKAPR